MRVPSPIRAARKRGAQPHSTKHRDARATFAHAAEAMGVPCRQYSVQCASPSGLHRLSYLEWGRHDLSRVLVCVHGLTRCARDFDALAQALASSHRVVCPDLPGRGHSDWLRNPHEYQLPTYLGDMVTLIARLDVEAVHWVGTSLGGLVGMALAALPESPVTRLVLNDVGPVLTAGALARIATYLGQSPALPTIEAAETYVRTVYASFGEHTDEQWRSLTEHVVRAAPDGSLRLHYDPALALPFGASPATQDVELWGMYDSIRCPTLVVRGERSDLLTRDTARQMSTRGPRARLVEIASVGHAPTLMNELQIGVVKEFLLADAEPGSREGG